MEKWKQIDRSEVWPSLVAGANVVSVALENDVPSGLSKGVKTLREKSVATVETLIAHKNVVFFVEV